MKKVKKSRYNVGDLVILTKDYQNYRKGQIFAVTNPDKKGKKYKIGVHDPHNGGNCDVPRKYLK